MKQIRGPVHRRYLLSSGKYVYLREPDVEDVEKSLMMVPGTMGQRQAMLRHRNELVRMCLLRVEDMRVTYMQLQGQGLKAVFPGAEGVRDLSQIGIVIDRLVNTLDSEDAAVFSGGQVADLDEPLPGLEGPESSDGSTAGTGPASTLPAKTSTSTRRPSASGAHGG